MTKILYLHGFASSADSTKAKVIESFVKKNTSSTKILIPDLDNNIKNAYQQIEEIIKTESPSSIIGSSLGGFFGTYFAEKYDLLCVNINPAIPPIDMSEYLGENQNYSTGEKFVIDQDQLDWLGLMNKKIKNLKKHKNFMTLFSQEMKFLIISLLLSTFPVVRLTLHLEEIIHLKISSLIFKKYRIF